MTDREVTSPEYAHIKEGPNSFTQWNYFGVKFSLVEIGNWFCWHHKCYIKRDEDVAECDDSIFMTYSRVENKEQVAESDERRCGKMGRFVKFPRDYVVDVSAPELKYLRANNGDIV